MSNINRGKGVREPLQVYLAPDERELLDELAAEHDVSRAEVLRRGIRSFAREQSGGSSPVFDFLLGASSDDLPADISINHDRYLNEAYRSKGGG